MVVAIIPARSGSKRIPNKNIRNFRDKPMIHWAIDKASKALIFDRIIVTTDCEYIAEISRLAGAETPFMRPRELADDITPTATVINHAIKECRVLGWEIQYACCIYPCTPLLRADDLKDFFDILTQTDANYVYPVTRYAHPVQRAMRRLPSGKMQFLQEECELSRTQDLEVTYHDAGQFYWGKTSAWEKLQGMHTNGIGVVVPNYRFVDIDSEEDWKRAEMLAGMVAVS